MTKRNAGQGLVEYCLVLLLVTIVVIIALRGLGATVQLCYFQPVESSLSDAGKP
ncbi:MAG TPA: Flp family type IVb pilin [Geobacter sp.]|nr:Flp family type IVb pilin [Geobacter sp.]